MARKAFGGKVVGPVRIVVLTCDPPYKTDAPGYVHSDTRTHSAEPITFTPDIWHAKQFTSRAEVDEFKKSSSSRTKRQLLTHEAIFRLRTPDDY